MFNKPKNNFQHSTTNSNTSKQPPHKKNRNNIKNLIKLEKSQQKDQKSEEEKIISSKIINIITNKYSNKALLISDKLLLDSKIDRITMEFNNDQIDKFIKTPPNFQDNARAETWNKMLKFKIFDKKDLLLTVITLKVIDILTFVETLYSKKEFFFEIAPRLKSLDIQYDPKLIKIILTNTYPFLQQIDNRFNQKQVELFFNALEKNDANVHQNLDTTNIRCFN